MFINTKFVSLAIACFLLASICQLVLQPQAAAARRFLNDGPPAGAGPSKAGVGGSQPRRDGSYTGSTSPSGTLLTPPATSITKIAYSSTNVTATSPNVGSSTGKTHP